jgi:hypothetical protein
VQDPMSRTCAGREQARSSELDLELGDGVGVSGI